MPKIFTTLDKIKPAYDITYKVVLFICKILLILDILITTMSVIGRYSTTFCILNIFIKSHPNSLN